MLSIKPVHILSSFVDHTLYCGTGVKNFSTVPQYTRTVTSVPLIPNTSALNYRISLPIVTCLCLEQFSQSLPYSCTEQQLSATCISVTCPAIPSRCNKIDDPDSISLFDSPSLKLVSLSQSISIFTQILPNPCTSSKFSIDNRRTRWLQQQQRLTGS